MGRGVNPQIYWANAMFSMADRLFNAQGAEVLRKAGYRVFLPQEATVNKLVDAPFSTAADIFRIDTCAILDSQLLVACIDQETIDCGVACEVGVAFAHGIPVIGLYTDIRQYRSGPGRMYKNLYVMGAIESIGEIVSGFDALPRTAAKYLRNSESTAFSRPPEETVSQHFASVASRYSQFIERLESWYEPQWSMKHVLERWIRTISPKRVIEFGCGTGDLGTYICRRNSGIFYLGYDKSWEMIQIANTRQSNSGCFFTASWTEVEKRSRNETFDMAIVPFILHDYPEPRQIITLLAQSLRPEGVILIADLSTWDLPSLTALLKRRLARPLLVPDSRIDPGKIAELVKAANAIVIDCEIAMPLVSFPSADDLNEYLEVFGIYEGMDIPLGLKNGKTSMYRRLIKQALEHQAYPFTDQRAFITCALKMR
jgi:nucleoside 2-deoxyribosyltransferase/2-polyprenyl-3-methyl-5-hydroxy-6-metoxy-1,4-benzoquinol methylase